MISRPERGDRPGDKKVSHENPPDGCSGGDYGPSAAEICSLHGVSGRARPSASLLALRKWTAAIADRISESWPIAAAFQAANASFRRPLMYNGRLMRKSCKKNKDGAK